MTAHPHARPPAYTPHPMAPRPMPPQPPHPPAHLYACQGCSHRRPDPPLTGWRLVRRIGFITGLVLLGITVLFGLVGWAALIVAL